MGTSCARVYRTSGNFWTCRRNGKIFGLSTLTSPGVGFLGGRECTWEKQDTWQPLPTFLWTWSWRSNVLGYKTARNEKAVPGGVRKRASLLTSQQTPRARLSLCGCQEMGSCSEIPLWHFSLFIPLAGLLLH